MSAHFQSYSNTYAPIEHLKLLHSEALSHPQAVGIVIGTRPDCVDEEKLDYIAGLAENHVVIVEYGIGSCNDVTLKRINRRHDFARNTWQGRRLQQKMPESHTRNSHI